MSLQHFFTGFPGFLATQISAKIAAQRPDDCFVFLVQRQWEKTARRLLATTFWSDRQVEVCVGDITQPDLGLGDRFPSLAASVDTVWHLAALYDLAVPERIAYEVNVRGTQHVADFCSASTDKPIRLNHVSTCYVSGTREGRIYEDELNTGQGHHNHYETTKFWSEVLVRKASETMPITIFRPSVAVGDSQTGETDKFDGPYFLLKVLAKFPRWLPSPGFGSLEGVVNVVPVDFVAQSIAHIGCTAEAVGETFHIADPNPMNAREFANLAIDCMGRKRAAASIPTAALDRILQWKEVEEFFDIPRELLAYFQHKARYDTANTQRLLAGSDIRCPHASSYLPNLVDYFLRAQDHPSKRGA